TIASTNAPAQSLVNRATRGGSASASARSVQPSASRSPSDSAVNSRSSEVIGPSKSSASSGSPVSSVLPIVEPAPPGSGITSTGGSVQPSAQPSQTAATRSPVRRTRVGSVAGVRPSVSKQQSQ